MRTVEDIGPEARELLGRILRHHAEQDAELIEAVRAHGSDPALPHRLRYYFYGEAGPLAVLRRFVEAEGLAVEEPGASVADPSLVPGMGESLMVATRWMPLTLDAVGALTARLATAAALNGAKLDGWETQTREKGDGLPERLPA